jgi:hypothetical protein
LEKLTSRKLLIAVFAIGLAVANKLVGLGLDQTTVTQVVLTAAAYIIGEAAVDAAAARNNQQP